jgi:hypothetical protein
MVLKFLDGKIIEYLDKLSNHRELNELEIEYLNIKEKTRKSDFILSTFGKTIVFIQGFLMLIIILNNSKPVSELYNIKIDETSPTTKIEYTIKNKRLFWYKKSFTEYIVKDLNDDNRYLISNEEQSVLNPSKEKRNIIDFHGEHVSVFKEEIKRELLSPDLETIKDKSLKSSANNKVLIDDLSK